MNVKELKEELDKLPDDMMIVMSSDGEGNKHSPLSDIGLAWYEAHTTWYGDCYNLDEDPEEFNQEDCEKVIVFWPVN